MLSLPASSSTSHHIKDASIEAGDNIQPSQATDFSKLLAAEMSGKDKASDNVGSELQTASAVTNGTGNSFVMPENPAALKGPGDTDRKTKTETDEDRDGTEGNIAIEMLGGSFQLSQPATILATAGVTNAPHIPVTGLPSAAVTGIETRTTADTRAQQQPGTASDQMPSGMAIPPASASEAYVPHVFAIGRTISPSASLVSEAHADADARSSDRAGRAAGENAVSGAQTMSPGMYPGSVAAGDLKERPATVPIAFSRVVPAAAARLPQDTNFSGTAMQEPPHSDSGSSGGRLAGIPNRMGELLPEVSHLHQALPAAGSDAPSPSTLTASVAPHELLGPLQPSGHLSSEPPTVPGTAVLSDHPLLRLEPRVGSGSWDNALGQRVLWMVSQQHQVAELNLNPPDLGPLQVVLSVNSDQASAAFVSQNPEVRQALEAALPRLKEMMAESGINLGSATVSDQGARQQGDFERQNRAESYYRKGESRIAAAATNSVGVGMSHRVAETGGHQLVDTFA